MGWQAVPSMKILLLGKDGQVGWELQRSLAPLGELIACNREQANLENPNDLRRLVEQVAPDIIVNAAAYTAVDKAETDRATARIINTDSVTTLAELAHAHKAWLIHYSTDYVFDGSKPTPYVETDATAPQSIYGQTKRDGENAITSSGCRHLILRTSWVYAARGSNFAKTMLRLAKEREELRVIADQFGAPTSAELIADTTALCLYRLINDNTLAQHASGTYHLVAGGETSWHGYAQTVISEALNHGIELKAATQRVHAIPTSEYPLPAKRPANSRMDTTKLRNTFGVTLPHWQYHVKRLMTELTQQAN